MRDSRWASGRAHGNLARLSGMLVRILLLRTHIHTHTRNTTRTRFIPSARAGRTRATKGLGMIPGMRRRRELLPRAVSIYLTFDSPAHEDPSSKSSALPDVVEIVEDSGCPPVNPPPILPIPGHLLYDLVLALAILR